MPSFTNNNKKNYLTPNEVAELLMVSPVTVRSWAQKGLLVARVTPGGHRRFLQSDVERFARERGAIQIDAKPFYTRILIVGSDPVMADHMNDILADPAMNYIAETARSGFEAGIKLRAFSPEVVLLDFTSPNTDGFGICSLIKKDAETQHIKVIAIAEDMSTGNVTRILEAGAERFLVKPFKPQDLLNVLSCTERQEGLEKSGAHAQHEPEPADSCFDDSEVVLFSLMRLVEARSSANEQHDSARLARMADVFGRSLGRLGTEELAALRNASLLHDIGTLGIPDSILLKPAPLTDEEWTIMRCHTLIGAQLCNGLRGMALTVPIIRSHHERWDGSGYPDGLKGEAIPYLARVFQFIDIFDALSSCRPYKPALPTEKVIAIIRQEIVNGLLDPYLGERFLTSRPQDFGDIRAGGLSGSAVQ